MWSEDIEDFHILCSLGYDNELVQSVAVPWRNSHSNCVFLSLGDEIPLCSAYEFSNNLQRFCEWIRYSVANQYKTNGFTWKVGAWYTPGHASGSLGGNGFDGICNISCDRWRQRYNIAASCTHQIPNGATVTDNDQWMKELSIKRLRIFRLVSVNRLN